MLTLRNNAIERGEAKEEEGVIHQKFKCITNGANLSFRDEVTYSHIGEMTPHLIN
jgi:hypothetical protein